MKSIDHRLAKKICTEREKQTRKRMVHQILQGFNLPIYPASEVRVSSAKAVKTRYGAKGVVKRAMQL